MSDAQLRDERAICNLVARYCHAIGADDDEAWAETWAEDGEWRVLGATAKGRAAALEHYRKLVANVSWVVQFSFDGIVEVDGDRATGRWHILEYLQWEGGRAGQNVGRYRDEYVRGADGEWRFAVRDFQPLYLGPPDLSVPAAAPRRGAS
ncbi:MAG: nuclear transport factor 2 family protein [Myxococcota bacterium]